MVPEDLRYTREHEWIKVEGDVATVGITDFAQGELGDVVFVELPKPGTVVEQFKAFGTIEAVKSVSDLFSPISGEVIEVNESLKKAPQQINQDAFEVGWMIKIRMKDPSELESLLSADEYKSLIGE